MYEHDFCEYAVEKKKEGKYLAALCLAVVAAAVLALCVIWFVIPLAGMSIGLLCFALLCLALWYLSRFSLIEYEYTQTGAILDFAAVYSKQYRKEKLSVDLKKDARLVAPVTSDRLQSFSIRSTLDLRSSASVKNAYVLVYQDDTEQKTVLFDATARMIANIRYQVPSVTEISHDLPE